MAEPTIDETKVEECECLDEKHEGKPCDCLACAEDPCGHPPTPCPIPPEKRPEMIAKARDKMIAEKIQKEEQTRFENKKKKIKKLMDEALAMAADLVGKWSYSTPDGRALVIESLAVKIYNELNAVEESDKPKLTDEELRSLVIRAEKIALAKGIANEVDAVAVAVILKNLLQ